MQPKKNRKKGVEHNYILRDNNKPDAKDFVKIKR